LDFDPLPNAIRCTYAAWLQLSSKIEEHFLQPVFKVNIGCVDW